MDAVYGSTIAAPVSFCAGHMPSWTRHPRRIGHYVPHASFRRSDRRPLDTRLRPCGTRSGVTLGLRVTIEPPRAPSVDTTTAHTLCASSERPRHATSSRRASRRHRAAHRAPLPTMRSCHASDYSTRAASHPLLQRTRYAPPPNARATPHRAAAPPVAIEPPIELLFLRCAPATPPTTAREQRAINYYSAHDMRLLRRPRHATSSHRASTD